LINTKPCRAGRRQYEIVNTLNEPIDRTLDELGGYSTKVLVQNKSADDVEVKVEFLD
jgi:hypothetical protein